MMPRLLAWTVALLVVATSAFSFADVKVSGYTRKDGTYVRPHHRSNPDGNFSNNCSKSWDDDGLGVGRGGGDKRDTPFAIGTASGTLTPTYPSSESARSDMPTPFSAGSLSSSRSSSPLPKAEPSPRSSKPRALPGEIPLTYTESGQPHRNFNRYVISY